jgi:peroxiredoxin
LDLEFGVGDDVDLAKRCAGKKVIMVGLPGAFTPT